MSELNTGTSEEQSLNTQITDEIDVAEVMQVPIDDTLSNSGEAADAKAVGDALALKADKSEIQTQIKVNGQSADNQGLILVDATDIPMSSTDNTTIKAAIETVDSKTAEDIPISDDEGAESIAEALANSGTRMADAIQMSATDERKVATAVNANTSALTALGETVTALQGRTAADILYQSGGTATIKSTVDALSGETVKSVNGEAPDSAGNVAIDKVSYADNLWTEDNQETAGEFLRRATGGDISLSDGDATVLKLMGNRVHTGFVAESITLTVTPYPRTAPAAISCSLDKATYLAYVTEAGTQVLTYDGEAWSESPALYGVTVTNTPIEDDEITLTWDGVNDPTMTVDAAPRTAPAAITATIDRDTFVAYVDESGTTTLYYTTEWSASPALYGITVTNDPVAGDQISVVYVKEVRGTITQANPTRIVATGWNLYESTNGYARVIPYSETYGYRIGGTYTSIAFADNAQGTGAETITPDENGLFTVDEPGYVIVTGGSTDTYILSTWSDWTTAGSEGTYEAYTEHSITLSGIISTYLIAGLCRVGNVRDEIDFVAQKVVSRVQRLAYSAENRAMAAGTGRAYEFDENYIYLERETPTESSITIDQTYQMCEHGFEYFDGTTVAVYAELLYGTNLKDKLRRISAQTVPMTYGQTGTVADAITSANAAIAKVDSNTNQMNDVLASAASATTSQFFKTGSAADYTGVIPNINYKYATFMVNVRGSDKTVIAQTITTNEIAINTYNDGTWTGWKELAKTSDVMYVNKTNSYKATSSNAEMVLSATIPAGYGYALNFKAEYRSEAPTEVFCGTDNNASMANYSKLATGVAFLNVNGYASSQTTLYFFCKRGGVPSVANGHYLTGTLFKAQTQMNL